MLIAPENFFDINLAIILNCFHLVLFFFFNGKYTLDCYNLFHCTSYIYITQTQTEFVLRTENESKTNITIWSKH